jgi:hypothetical protein
MNATDILTPDWLKEEVKTGVSLIMFKKSFFLQTFTNFL